MGLIEKIEEKLGGGKSDEKKLEKQEKQELKHENAGHKGGMSGLGGSSGQGSRMQDMQHPIGTATTSGQGYGSGGYRDDGYGGQPSGQKTQASQPYDPFSSKGQSIAAAAAPDTTHYGTDDSRLYSDDSNPSRSKHGGIMNSSNEPQQLHSGPHSRLENQDAIPTAGGEKVGGLGERSGQKQHHFGRDAAVAGGVGATGAGAYEAEKHHRNHPGQSGQHHLGQSRNEPGYENDLSGRMDQSHLGGQQQHHYGRDAAVAGGVGTAGVGAYEAEKHHRDHKHEKDYQRSGQGYGNEPSYQNDLSGGRGQGAMGNNPQHHYGRDAAVAGGLGTAGVGAYEADKHHRDHKHEKEYQQSGQGYGNEPGYQNDLTGGRGQDQMGGHQQHHYGRDAAVAGGLGTAGVGAYEAEKHHHNHQNQQDASNLNKPLPGMQGGQGQDPYAGSGSGGMGMGMGAGQGGDSAGLHQVKKMGGAYEAGYRDAMEHMKAEMRK